MNSPDIRAWEILKRLPWHNPVGVEVGIFRGGLSWRLLAARDDLALHMVDAWGLNQSDAFKASDDYHAALSQDEQDEHETVARHITEFAEARRHVVKALSVDAAARFADGSLDFVFIDADHSYEGCRADIAAWWPKVRPGGWLCGHDYANDDFAFGAMVKRAVDEFAALTGLAVERGANFTWFIRAPGERADERLPWDVTVACVKQGAKYPSEYVNILRAMVGKNLHKLHRFVCLTDDPQGLDEGIEVIPLTENLPGWWSKLELFKPGQFEGRVLYLDLDVVVTGPLDPLAETDGIIKDWHLPGYNSSVMSWSGDEWSLLWTEFTPQVMKDLRGDQDWMNVCADAYSRPAHFPADWCISHIGTEQWPPAGARVVCFHGAVKPHMKPYPWVELMWAKNGMGCVEFTARLTEDRGKIFDNVRVNLKRGLPMLTEAQPHDGTLCIVGGGPSLNRTLVTLRARQALGDEIWALNGASEHLTLCGITHTGHVIADAREDNIAFLYNSPKAARKYLAATSHPSLFDWVRDDPVTLWTPDMDGMAAALEELGITNKLMVGGGPTVMLKALCIGYARGWRRFELFGVDSSFDGDEGHAYAQPLNDSDKDNRIDVWCDGRKFSCAPWMYRQAQAFQAQAKVMADLGCQINVYGDGLIPWLAQAMTKPKDQAA